MKALYILQVKVRRTPPPPLTVVDVQGKLVSASLAHMLHDLS